MEVVSVFLIAQQIHILLILLKIPRKQHAFLLVEQVFINLYILNLDEWLNPSNYDITGGILNSL